MNNPYITPSSSPELLEKTKINGKDFANKYIRDDIVGNVLLGELEYLYGINVPQIVCFHHKARKSSTISGSV